MGGIAFKRFAFAEMVIEFIKAKDGELVGFPEIWDHFSLLAGDRESPDNEIPRWAIVERKAKTSPRQFLSTICQELSGNDEKLASRQMEYRKRHGGRVVRERSEGAKTGGKFRWLWDAPREKPELLTLTEAPKNDDESLKIFNLIYEATKTMTEALELAIEQLKVDPPPKP